MDYFEALIHRAACAVTAAAEACRDWEDGGDPGPVSDTASEADEATREALEAVAGYRPRLHPRHLSGDPPRPPRDGGLLTGSRP